MTEEEVFNAVYKFFKDDEKAHMWMTYPNPMLGGATPVGMINAGKLDKMVAEFAWFADK